MPGPELEKDSHKIETISLADLDKKIGMGCKYANNISSAFNLLMQLIPFLNEKSEPLPEEQTARVITIMGLLIVSTAERTGDGPYHGEPLAFSHKDRVGHDQLLQEISNRKLQVDLDTWDMILATDAEHILRPYLQLNIALEELKFSLVQFYYERKNYPQQTEENPLMTVIKNTLRRWYSTGIAIDITALLSSSLSKLKPEDGTVKSLIDLVYEFDKKHRETYSDQASILPEDPKVLLSQLALSTCQEITDRKIPEYAMEGETAPDDEESNELINELQEKLNLLIAKAKAKDILELWKVSFSITHLSKELTEELETRVGQIDLSQYRQKMLKAYQIAIGEIQRNFNIS